jgi:hypothetical protein
MKKMTSVTPLTEEGIKEAFDRFDANGSGGIDKDEVLVILKQFNVVKTADEVVTMMSEACGRRRSSFSADASGTINFDEFSNIVKSTGLGLLGTIVKNTALAKTGGSSTVRLAVEAVLERHPSIAPRCKPDEIVANLEAWGIMDVEMLDDVLGQSTMLSQIMSTLEGAAPPSFTALLAKSRLATETTTEKENAVEIMAAHPATLPIPQISSRFRAVMTMVHPVEWMVLKDHWREWREHWIASRQHDPAELRGGLMGGYEVELIFATLMLGIVTSIYFSGAVTEEMNASFTNLEVASLGFWINVSGIASIIFSFFTTMTTYLTLMLVMPVSDENLLTFLKAQSTMDTLMVPNMLLVLTFYSTCFLLCLILLATLGVSNFSVILIVGLMLIAMGAVFYRFNLSFNHALNAGMFSSVVRVSPQIVESASPREIEQVLSNIALGSLKQHGQTMPIFGGSTASIRNFGYEHDPAKPAQSRPGPTGMLKNRKRAAAVSAGINLGL